jgi:hypothetical protein
MLKIIVILMMKNKKILMWSKENLLANILKPFTQYLHIILESENWLFKIIFIIVRGLFMSCLKEKLLLVL